MHETERALINVFSSAPENTFTTTQLVATVFADDYHALRDSLHSNDAAIKKRAKRHKAQLHRKLLYHLNKLLDKGVLRIAEIQARGEKAYMLASTASELILADDTETITITRHERPQRFISAHEDAGRVYSRSTALHTVDAYAINAKAYPGLAHLRNDLTHAYTHVNDAILVSNAHTLLEMPQESISAGISQLDADTQDYNVAITLHIDLRVHQLAQRHLAFFRTYALHRPKRLYVVFAGTPQDLKEQHTMLVQILGILSADKMKINIQNVACAPTIHFYGEAGSYVLSTAQQRLLETHNAVIVLSASCLIDSTKVLRAAEHPQLLEDVAKTLLAHTAGQRRLAHKALAGLARIAGLREQLTNPSACIRYYNFELDEPFSALMAELREHANGFAEIHNRIYSSCGVPIDFELQISTGFIHYADIPSRRYKKTPVRSKQDLSSQPLRMREQLLRSLHTDRLRIFRETPYSAADLCNEIISLCEHYSFPMVCYDVRNLQTTLSLQHFLT